MIVKPHATTDNFDLSWIHKQAICWVYFPLEEQAQIFLKGVVKGIVPLSFNKGNSKVMGMLENGTQFQTKAHNLQKCRQSNHLERDLINLQIINAAEVLNQLNRKLGQKKIHTYLWNSLIIVNPFKMIPSMYGESSLQYYYENIFEKKQQLLSIQPHVYAYVSDILNKLRSSEKIQMLSISGESGSGKTQTNKQCLKILSYICQKSGSGQKKQIKTIQEKILNCDGIMQSFGNAKTSKNDNSSRFGKLITQKINKDKMEIISAEIKVFFLQKSRIIHQFSNQRNFHVFYQLLKFCPSEHRETLFLKTKYGTSLKITDFNFLKKTQHAELTIVDDEEMWNELLKSFNLLEFSNETILEVWKILVAILYIGNLEFDDDNLNDHDPCDIVNEQVVKIISSLIDLPVKDLLPILVFHKKILAGQTFNVPMTETQCIQNSRTLAKALYENLFIWIVNELNRKVNESKKSEKNMRIIKLLDIYGFQVFQRNSFQQLCVNFTNQRIHQVYLDQVFKHEKDTLKKEGLQSAIPTLNFTDNKKILQLLDISSKSIYNLLDESCTLNVRDEDYLSNIKKNCEGHEHFPPSNNVTIKKAFIIKHTPCEIEYMVEGFRSKNKDFLKQDIAQKLSTSKSKIISQKFKQQYNKIKSETNKKYLGFKIRKQVSALINQISLNSDIHFIRCIKPNEEKKPLTFVERVCYNQIKYLGILDTVQMRKSTYHVRLHYDKFYKKYGILDGDIKKMLKVQNHEYTNEQCKEFTKNFFLNNFKNQSLEYLFGRDRLFMKMSTQNFLDTVFRNQMAKFNNSSTIIKALCRYTKQKNKRKNYLVQVKNVQKSIRNFLKIAEELRYKKAVKVIEREWIKRCGVYFRRKRRPALMVVQKNLKSKLAKLKTQDKQNSLKFARLKLSSMAKSHKIANRFENYQQIKRDVKTNIYNQIWKKMSKHYRDKMQVYVKSFQTKHKHKKQISIAKTKTKVRLESKSRIMIQKYFHTTYYANKTQKVLNTVLRLQSIYKMHKIRNIYLSFKQKVIKIQRSWRHYYQNKQLNQRYVYSYFPQASKIELKWANTFHRNLNKNILVHHEGVERILYDFQKVKKDKISLFYYLLDIQVLCDSPSLDNWHEKYASLFEDNLFKFNPIQYIDISNTQTVVSTTNKVYSWGSFTVDSLPGVQEHIVPNGKISKISASDQNIKITLPNNEDIIIGDQHQDKKDHNKDWSTLNDNFVLLNGAVLTVDGCSFTKLNISEKVSQISCGMAHIICKTMLKKVYTWGKNQMGQLGHGNYHQSNNFTPKLVQYFNKKKIMIAQVGATPYGSVVIDYNGKIFWFGSNGTIKYRNYPEECLLNDKSNFLGNTQKYTPLRIIPKWSKTISIIGITVACHDNVLKNQISLRKKTFESLMQKWNQDINTINPPFNQNISNYFLERHMSLPIHTDSKSSKNTSHRDIKEKLLTDIGLLEQAERELLRTRKYKK